MKTSQDIDNENEQTSEQKRKRGVTMNTVIIGFCGGLIWGMISFIAYYLNFSTVGPALILNPWAFGDWKNKITGQLVAIPVISIASIIVACVYKLIFVKIRSIFAGILFGLALWFSVFYLLEPYFPDLETLTNIGWNTITTTVCIFVLYGIFIGYSITFDYYEDEGKTASTSYSNN